MGKFITLLSCMLLVFSCDDRCGDRTDQGYVKNKTDSTVKFKEFFRGGITDSVVITSRKSTFVQVTIAYEYLNIRLDSVIFEKEGKSITFRNMKYGDNLNATNHYFNKDNWHKEAACRGIAYDLEYTIQNIDFD